MQNGTSGACAVPVRGDEVGVVVRFFWGSHSRLHDGHPQAVGAEPLGL